MGPWGYMLGLRPNFYDGFLGSLFGISALQPVTQPGPCPLHCSQIDRQETNVWTIFFGNDLVDQYYSQKVV